MSTLNKEEINDNNQWNRIAMDRQGSEYAWIHSWIMLKYSYTCLKQNLESLYKLLNAHRYTHIMVIDIVLKEIKFIKCIERLHIYSLLLIQIYIGIYRFVMTLLYSISAQKMYLMKQKSVRKTLDCKNYHSLCAMFIL